MLPVRIHFHKTAAAKYISHLDLNRTFIKGIIRARLPVLYSEGFNPHPKLIFSTPVSLGVESYAEFADIKLTQPLDYHDIKARLRKEMPIGIEVQDVYAPNRSFNEISRAEYDINISADISPEALRGIFDGDIPLDKRTKTKMVRINLRDYICSLNISGRNGDGYYVIDAILTAGPSDYINPDYVAAAVKLHTSVSDYYITKKSVYIPSGEVFM